MRSMIGNKKICTNLSKVGSSSEIITVGGADELSISLTFASNTTGAKVSFWISTDSENWHECEGNCAKDGSTYMTSTTFTQLFSFDVSSGTSWKLTLDEITTGAICAYATSFAL